MTTSRRPLSAEAPPEFLACVDLAYAAAMHWNDMATKDGKSAKPAINLLLCALANVVSNVASDDQRADALADAVAVLPQMVEELRAAKTGPQGHLPGHG